MSEKLGSTMSSPNTGEVANTDRSLTADGDKRPMTREQRVADGREKLNALKDKVREGLCKTWKKLSEGFYVGASYGFELSGKTKEKVGNAYTAAKAKAAELFAGGREVISQKAAEARTRKRVRQWQREMRAGDRDVSRSEREAERQQYRRAKKQDGEDNTADKAVIGDNKEAIKSSRREQKEVATKLEAAERKRREAERKAKVAAAEAKAAKEAADADPSDEKKRLEAARRHGLSIAANAELESAELDVNNLKDMINSAKEKINKAKTEIDEVRGRIEDRANKARARKNARRPARREALGDKWESAKEKVARVAGKSADWMKHLGKKISSGIGKVARKVANRLDPVESDSNK